MQENVTREVEIVNRLGIHARPATLIAKTSARFASNITLEKDGLEVNGKSVMGIMMLVAAKGTKIRIVAEGEDAEAASDALEELITSGFDET